MGFWHTGYAEFHEPSGLEEYVYSPPPPVRYVCEHCSESFAELEGLRRHRFEQHPVRQPALWLRGRAAGALPQLLMTPLQPADVVIEDAVRCLLNGSPVPLASLGERLAGMNKEFIELQLENAGATTRCVLDFRIADETHLAGVEAAFLRVARDHVLSIDALSRFIHDCREFPSAMPYCDGICHYLYGVMAKERAPDSGLQQAQYVERYLRASDELSGFDRPLARSIRALVAFHFNHFDDAELLAPEGALRHAAGAFADLPAPLRELLAATAGCRISLPNCRRSASPCAKAMCACRRRPTAMRASSAACVPATAYSMSTAHWAGRRRTPRWCSPCAAATCCWRRPGKCAWWRIPT